MKNKFSLDLIFFLSSEPLGHHLVCRMLIEFRMRPGGGTFLGKWFQALSPPVSSRAYRNQWPFIKSLFWFYCMYLALVFSMLHAWTYSSMASVSFNKSLPFGICEKVSLRSCQTQWRRKIKDKSTSKAKSPLLFFHSTYREKMTSLPVSSGWMSAWHHNLQTTKNRHWYIASVTPGIWDLTLRHLHDHDQGSNVLVSSIVNYPPFFCHDRVQTTAQITG